MVGAQWGVGGGIFASRRPRPYSRHCGEIIAGYCRADLHLRQDGHQWEQRSRITVRRATSLQRPWGQALMVGLRGREAFAMGERDREGTRSARHLPYRDPHGIAVFGWHVENPRALKGISTKGAKWVMFSVEVAFLL